jgi:membrane-associated phospholipid phosphatase
MTSARPVGRLFRFAALAALAPLLFACSSARLPTADQWRSAAVHALTDRETWIPAAGAVVIAASGTDRDIAEWASDNTPLFGSNDNAEDASNTLKGAAHGVMIASALILPSPAGWRERLSLLAADEAVMFTVRGVTDLSKQAAGRERPNRRNLASFPSGHASSSQGYSALARANLEHSNLSSGWVRTLSAGSHVFVAGTMWARIEAGQHYPTDVLAGAALGNFIASLLHHAVIDERLRIAVEPRRDGVAMSVGVTW